MSMLLPDRSGGNLSEVLNIAAVPFQWDTVDTCHTHTHTHTYIPTMLNFHFRPPPTLFLWLQTSQLFSPSSQTSKQKRRSKNERMLCQGKCTDPVSISLFDNQRKEKRIQLVYNATFLSDKREHIANMLYMLYHSKPVSTHQSYSFKSWQVASSHY